MYFGYIGDIYRLYIQIALNIQPMNIIYITEVH